MADDEEQLGSDKDGETTDAETQEQVKASRYNLRPRQATREQETSHQASPLFHLVNRGELENDSAASMVDLRKTPAATEVMLTASSASVTTARGLARPGVADGNQHVQRDEDSTSSRGHQPIRARHRTKWKWTPASGSARLRETR